MAESQLCLRYNCTDHKRPQSGWKSTQRNGITKLLQDINEALIFSRGARKIVHLERCLTHKNKDMSLGLISYIFTFKSWPWQGDPVVPRAMEAEADDSSTLFAS